MARLTGAERDVVLDIAAGKVRLHAAVFVDVAARVGRRCARRQSASRERRHENA